MENRIHSNIFVLFVFVFLCGLSSGTRAQNLDSLENIVKTGQLKSSEKLRLYHDLSYGYAYTDFRKSVFYAQEGIILSEKENNLTMTGAFYQDLGIAYYMFSNLDSASIYLNTALEYAVKSGNKQLEATINAVTGNLYAQKGIYMEAMRYYMQALPILEKDKKKEQLGVLYGNIADLYQALHNYDQALDYYSKAESMAIEFDDYSSLSCAWIGLSDVYFEKGMYDQALEYAEKALKILQTIDDQINEVIALNAVARCYYKGYQNYDQAEEYAKKALQKAETSGFPASKAVSLRLLSDIAFSKGKYKKSEYFAFQALEADSSDINLNSDLIFNIALANIAIGDRDKAVDYFKRYTRLIDTRANKEFQSTLSEMQVKYEMEKQNIRIAALEKEKRLSDWLAIMGGILLMAAIIIMSLRYRMIQNQKRLGEQQAFQQMQEQQLAATKAVLEGETSGQSRMAQILHDSLSGRLSVAKMSLSRLKKNHLPEFEIEREFEQTIEILDSSIRDLNRTAIYIMPHSLAQYGLKTSLTDFCKTIPCVQFFFFGKDLRFDSMLELTIYRTVYELVTAALQHERTTQVNIQLVLEEHHVSLTVQEDSRDFDAPVFEDKVIMPIRNRIKTLNGTVNIYYPEEAGTEISVEFGT